MQSKIESYLYVCNDTLRHRLCSQIHAVRSTGRCVVSHMSVTTWRQIVTHIAPLPNQLDSYRGLFDVEQAW